MNKYRGTIPQENWFCKNLSDYLCTFPVFLLYLSDTYLITPIFYMRFFLRFIITATAIYCLIQWHYLSGVTLTEGVTSLFVFVFTLGLVNLIVGGVLRLITLPIRWLTLWLLGFAISLFVVYLTDEFVTGVTIIGWLPLVIIAVVMGFVTAIIG